jgi:hypothetical protein
MNTRRWALLVTACLMSIVACKSDAERAAANAKTAALAVRQLTAIAAATPKAERLTGTTTCPAALADGRPYMIVDLGWVAQFGASGFVAEDPASLPPFRRFTAQDKDYRGIWFRGDKFKALAAGMKASPRDDRAIAQSYTGIVARGGGKGLIVAVHAASERLPKIRNYPGPGDVVLEPASFEGWALLFDPRSAKLQCQVRFSAKSSSSLSFRSGGDPLNVAFEDFEHAFSNSIEAAFAQRGAKLQRHLWP